MTVYLINIFLIIMFGAFFLYGPPLWRNKKLFCVLATSQWVLLSGLRHISIGADTYSYKVTDFDLVIQQTWRSLFENFINVLFRGASGKDPGYALFEKAVQIFTTNYQVYLVVIALVFTVSLGIWIYRNSSEPVISFLIYSCLFYGFFAITGHRQTIATAMVVLIGYKFIKERKFWPFLAITLIAMTIHKSSVIFFPFYFIASKKITIKHLITSLIIGAVILFLGKSFYALAATFLGYDVFINNEIGGTKTFTLMIILIGAVVFSRMKIILKNNSQATHFLNAYILALLLSLMTLQNQSFMRAQQYFSLFIMLLIPEIMMSFSKKDRVVVYYFTAGTLLLLFVFAGSNLQYLFFWQ